MKKIERFPNICNFPPIGLEPENKPYFLVYNFKFTKKFKLRHMYDEPETDPDYLENTISWGTSIFNVQRDKEGYSFEAFFEGEMYQFWTYYPWSIAEDTLENRLCLQELQEKKELLDKLNKEMRELRVKLKTLETLEEKEESLKERKEEC
jgi:hypothetical protein